MNDYTMRKYVSEMNDLYHRKDLNKKKLAKARNEKNMVGEQKYDRLLARICRLIEKKSKNFIDEAKRS